MALLSSFFRILRWVLVGLVAIVLLLVAGIAYLGLTPWGNQFLANQIAARIASPDLGVDIRGARGLLQGRFHLDGVTLSDSKGKYAELGDVDIFWTPSELLKLRFHAERVTIKRVDLDRVPVTTQPSSQSSGSFSLPVEVKVDSFALPQLTLGPAVAGQQTRISLDGAAQALADRLAVTLNAAEKDRLNATAKADLAYAVNAGTLSIDATVSEPPGGLLARLLALPGRPAVDIAVKGEGPLADWKGSVRGTVAGKDVLLLTGSHRSPENGVHDIVLNGGGQISELLPAQFRSLFAGNTKVDVDARLADTGLLDIRSGTVSNDSLVLAANGTLDPKGQAKLTARLTPAGPSLYVNLPFGAKPASAEITEAQLVLDGAYRSAKLDLSASLASLSLPQAQVSGVTLSARSSDVNLEARTANAIVTFGAQAITSDDQTLARLIDGPVTIRGDAQIQPQGITLANTAIDAGKLTGMLAGNLDLPSQTAQGNFKLSLAPQGLLPSALRDKLQGRVNLTGQIAATLPSRFSLQKLRVTSSLANASGSISVDGDEIRADLGLDVADIGALGPAARGAAHLALKASGSLAKPAIDAQLTSSSITVAGEALQTIVARFKTILDLTRPGGRLEFSALYKDAPLRLSADAAFIDGKLSLPSLSADVAGNKLSGGLDFDTAFLPAGAIDFDLGNLAGLAKLAGQQAEGALKGKLTLSRADSKITAELNASGPRLSASGAELRDIGIQLRAADLLARKLTGTLTAKSLNAQSLTLADIDLGLNVDGDRAGFTLASQFDAAPLSASGAILQSPQSLGVELASFAAKPRGIAVTLATPAKLDIANGTVSIDTLSLRTGDGLLAVSGKAGPQLDLTAKADRLPLSLGNSVVPDLGAEGTLSADARIIGTAARPIVEFAASTEGLATSQTRAAKLPPLAVTAKGRFADQKLALDATTDLRGQATHAVADVEFTSQGVSVPSLQVTIGESRLSGSLQTGANGLPTGTIAFDIPDAAALAAIVEQKAEGSLRGKVDLAPLEGGLQAKVDATGTIRGQEIATRTTAAYSAGRLSLPQLDFRIGRNNLGGAVTLDAAMMPSGQIRFDLPDIGLLAAMAGQKAEGALSGSADIIGKDGRIDADIKAEGALQGQPLDLQTRISYAAGAVSLPSLALKSGANSISGALALNEHYLPSGTLQFDLPDLATLAALAGQKAEGGIKGSADLKASGANLSADVTAKGAVRGQTVDLRTRVALDAGKLSVPSLSAAIGANRLDGQLALGAGNLPTGSFTFDLPDIGLVAAMAGQQAAGDLKGKVTLRSEAGKLLAGIKAEGQRIDYAGVTVSAPAIDLASGDLQAAQLSGTVTADTLTSGDNTVTGLALDLDRAGTRTGFDLKAQYDATPLTAKGNIEQQPDGLLVTLSELAASPRKIPVVLAQPAEIRVNDGTAIIPGLTIKAGDGAVTVSGKAGQVLDLQAKVTALPVSLANAVSPGLDATGIISADATITGAASDPVVTFTAKTNALATRQTRSAGLPALDIAASGRFAQQVLDVQAETDLRGQNTRVDAQVKLGDQGISIPSLKATIGKTTLSGALTLDPQFKPSGQIRFDIPDANALAGIVGRKAEGALQGTADISSDPAGALSIKLDADGKLRNQPLKAFADVSLHNGAVSLPSLKLDVGPNTVSGAVTLGADLLPSGKIDFGLPDLALLAAMAGQKAEGSLKGSADIQSVNSRTEAKVDATGRIRNQDVGIRLDAIRDTGKISIPTLAFDVGRNKLDGNLSLDERFLPSGKIRFDLPDLALLGAMAGQKAEGVISGEADLTTENGKLAGSIKASGPRISAAGAEIVNPSIDLSIADLTAGQISGRVTADRLAQGSNAVTGLALDMDHAGTRTAFDLKAQYDDAPLSAKGSIEQKPEGVVVSLSELAAAPKKIPLALSQPTEIDVANGTVSIPPLTIKAGNGAVTVSGKAGQVLDLQAKVTALPASIANAVSPGLDAAGIISADASITGAASDPIVTFTAKTNALATSQTHSAGLPALDIAASGRFAQKVLDVKAETDLRGQPTHVEAQVKLGDQGISIPSLKANIGKTTLSGALAFDPPFKPSGQIRFDVPDADALARIVGRKAEGALRGTADLSTDPAGALSIKLDADGKLRNQPIKALTDIRLAHGGLSLPSLKLDVGPNTVSGAITLGADLLPSGKIDFDLPDLALLTAMAGQKAEGSLKGSADIQSVNSRTEAKVNATGRIRNQDVGIRLDALRDAGKISIPTLALDVGRNKVEGNLSLDERFLPSGKIRFDLPDLALLGAMAGQKAEGAVSGEADLTTENGKLAGSIKASGPRISAAGAEIVKPSVNLSIADLTSGQISGRVTADRLAQGTNAVTGLALDLDHAGTRTAFDLKAQYDAAPLAAKGSVDQQPDRITLALETFKASPRRIPVSLAKPTSIRIAGGKVSLDGLAIRAGQGSITVNGQAGQTLDLSAKVTALPASLADAVSPGLGAAGTISATVTVKGSASAPTVAFDTRWQNAAVAQTRAAGLAAFSVSAKGKLANNVLSINADAKGAQGLSLNAGGTVAVTGNRALNIRVAGQLPFAAIAPLLAPQGLDLKGNARFDLTVAGSASAPAVTGRITTSGATLTAIRQNVTVKNLAATVALDGKQARISSLSGNLSGGGTVSVSGTIGIAPGSGFPADLRIALKNAVYTDAKVVAAKVSGDLTVTGSLIRRPTLGGTVRIRRADISIPQKLPGTLAQIRIRHKHAPADVLRQAEAIRENEPGRRKGADKGGIALDLSIIAPRQIFVRGRGLDAELGGRVLVTGTSAKPNVAGGFKMLRGRLSIIGRRLDFTTGEISFGGNLTPALNLVATSTVDATTINVVVSGLANDPTVTFTSSPALPQDEVMALLIFGRNSADLSPVQIAQLADAASTLAGGQSTSLFAKLRQGLGVDDLDVGTDENGKSNVSVGKYLNKRTYIQLQQNVDDNTTSAVINLDVGKGVKLKGGVGSDGSTTGGVFFEKEY